MGLCLEADDKQATVQGLGGNDCKRAGKTRQVVEAVQLALSPLRVHPSVYVVSSIFL
jgi:hypothetical protein